MTAPQPKRRWYQFSLLSLLVLMTAAAGAMGVWAYQLKRYRERQAAISRVVEIVNEYDGYVVEGQEFTFAKNGPAGERLRTFLNDLQLWDDVRCLHLEGTGANDENMKQLGKLQSLEKLILNDTQVTDRGLRELSGLTNLVLVSVDNCPITDVGLTHISKLSKLEYLQVGGTKITDEGLQKIAELKDLIWIELENCDVSDAGLKHLSILSKLEYLEIDGTKITPTGKKWIQERLPKLQINARLGKPPLPANQ